MVEYHLFPLNISQEPINWASKYYLGNSSDTLCRKGEVWKGDISVVDIEDLEKMDASEIDAKRLNAKEVITLKIGEIFYLPDRR